jgi:hypothetical protein
MDADLLSWYANYFTRFMELVASGARVENAQTQVGTDTGWNSFSAKHWLRCAVRRR